uniref:Uncharacterized protein n=1 Tax=Heliothis virescens TaxID=7102 RepID=A0A2A4JJY2_HELVI
MEVTTEAWRVKHPRHWISAKPVKGDENGPNKVREEDQKKAPKDPKDTQKDTKTKKEFTLCFFSKRKKFIPAPRPPSLVSLAARLNNSCCQCCHVLAEYFLEVFHCVVCMVNCRIPCMHFEALFCELMDATGTMCRDMFRLVRAFLKVCVGSKDE